VVLTGRCQAVENLGCRGALVGLNAVALAQIDKRVRLFRAAGHHAARAVVFEAAAHQGLAVCQQSRGERVALETFEQLAVELERDLAVAVDQAALGCDAGAHGRASGREMPVVRVFGKRRRVMRCLSSESRGVFSEWCRAGLSGVP